MSRSNYIEDCDNEWEMICWRGAVASAIKGKRGLQMFRDMLSALDAMPEKRLIANSLEAGDGVCALGCLARAKAIDVSRLEPGSARTSRESLWNSASIGSGGCLHER